MSASIHSLAAPDGSRSRPSAKHTNGGLSIAVPAELVDAIAELTADLVAERLASAAAAPAWLDVDQAAAYLACKPKRIYDLVGLRRLQHAKDGRRLLFRAAWLDAALEVVEEGRR